jgi:hypothetical protein
MIDEGVRHLKKLKWKVYELGRALNSIARDEARAKTKESPAMKYGNQRFASIEGLEDANNQ